MSDGIIDETSNKDFTPIVSMLEFKGKVLIATQKAIYESINGRLVPVITQHDLRIADEKYEQDKHSRAL